MHFSPLLASLGFCLIGKFSQPLSQSLRWHLLNFG
jgi:hypothetical protein